MKGKGTQHHEDKVVQVQYRENILDFDKIILPNTGRLDSFRQKLCKKRSYNNSNSEDTYSENQEVTLLCNIL